MSAENVESSIPTALVTVTETFARVPELLLLPQQLRHNVPQQDRRRPRRRTDEPDPDAQGHPSAGRWSRWGT